MIELEKYKAKLMRLLEDDNWVRWVHEGTIPAYSSADKSANIKLSIFLPTKRKSTLCYDFVGTLRGDTVIRQG